MKANRAQLTNSSSRSGNSHTCPRHELQTARNALTRRLRQLESGLSIAPEIVGDDPDPLIQEDTKNLVLARQLEKHLDTIDRTLQAADRGEYGICERCGEPIDPERLLVLPEARLCLVCKIREEKMGKAVGPGRLEGQRRL